MKNSLLINSLNDSNNILMWHNIFTIIKFINERERENKKSSDRLSIKILGKLIILNVLNIFNQSSPLSRFEYMYILKLKQRTNTFIKKKNNNKK